MLTVSQVAALTGVAEGTLRMWERRYGVVDPARSPGGYRLYDDDQVALLREMASLVDAGVPASRAAATLLHAPRVVAAAPVADALHPDALVAAAASLDPRRLREVVERAFASAAFEVVADDWLLPQLGRLGQAWASGRLSVAQEHFASAGIMRALAAQFEAAGPGRGEPVLVGLPAGAHHEIALLSFAVCLRRLGDDVVYLGPDLPADGWVRAAAERHPRAAVLGVTSEAAAVAAAEVATRLARIVPPVAVWVGGSKRGLVAGAHELPDRVSDAAGLLHRALRAGRS